MSLEINQSSAGDKLKFKVRRGSTFRARLELYQSGAAAGSCAAAVLGDPLDLSGYDTVAAAGEIEGTSASILVTSAFIDKGAVDRPAVVSLVVEPVAIEACFAEGAKRRFSIEVVARAPGVTDSLVSGTVDVLDSAFGAVR